MKTLKPTLGLVLLSMFVFNNSMAQKANFTNHEGLTIGLGAGYAYQKSDLENSRGFGLDFTLGSQLYYKENAFLSVDWKFRFLAGENRAYDHRINPDDTYSNIRYSFFNYDLELGLTLNRLRERTRIVLTGFAGFGITHGRTFIDLYDAGYNLYDYSSIDPNRDRKLVYNDLVALSDGEFETRLVNKAALLPTAGIFLGYQLSQSLTLGVEFKTNFYLTEENSFVGIDLDNSAISGSGIDRNNYVSLGVRWNLRGGTSHNSTTDYYSPGVTNNHPPNTHTVNPVVPVSLPYPSVNITDPSTDAYHTESPYYTIRATINNVSGSDKISFYQNGYPNNTFTYNLNTKIFVANIRLRDGENSLRIKATNQGSSAEDLALITLDNPPDAVIPAPTVDFTSPAGNQVISSSDRIDVTASVKNVSSKEDIQLTLNGSNTSFEFYPFSGVVKTSVLLSMGDNDLFIKGFNESGTAQDQLILYFSPTERRAIPTVRFIHPETPIEVIDNRFDLSAEIQNVRVQNDISVKINGTRINNFYFDTYGNISVSLLLREGINTMEITARNEAGFASESTSVTYHIPVYIEPAYPEPVYPVPVYPVPVYPEPVYPEPVVRGSPPEIIILSPVTNPLRTYQQSEDLRATILHVNSKDNITLKINGLNTRDFSFSSSTKLLTTRVALRDGENILTISAQNESGGDGQDQLFFKATRPCRLPAIRLIDPAQGQSTTDQQIYTVKAEIRNMAQSKQLQLTANGKPVTFSLNNNLLSSSVPLISGHNTLSLSARNECGEDKVSARITFNPPEIIVPCTPPTVSFTLTEVNRQDATHELRGSVSGVKNKTDISLTLDGRAQNGFQFNANSGVLSAKFKLTPGSHTVVVEVINACGKDSNSKSVTLEEAEEEEEEEEAEKECGIRINPGNSAWQFCLVTPSRTYSRENLTNANFSYSGPASSLYIMPIGGGGTATVNGRSYAIRSGQYYLFTGRLTVTVSTKNPGSMGHWSVCISTDKAPVSGNGNNRPKSPCEVQKEDTVKEKGNRR